MLFNFDIAGDNLKPEHESFLRLKVAPLLRNSGSASILGLASRSGEEASNLDLSRRRAVNTKAALLRCVGRTFQIRLTEGVGEQFARRIGQPDGLEDMRCRSVFLELSQSPIPPPHPDIPDARDIVDGIISDGPEFSPGAGEWFDILSWIFGTVEIGGSIAIAAGASVCVITVEAIGLLGSTFGVAAMAFGYFQGIRTMEQLAEFNGYGESFARTMQSMANQFNRNALDKLPFDRWPSVMRPPISGVNPNPRSSADRYHNQGCRKGNGKAYELISKLDVQPAHFRITNHNNEIREIRLRGRELLRLLHLAWGSNVHRQIIAKVGSECRARGLNGFPVTAIRAPMPWRR
jgi:hypothetical protein